MRILYHHRTRAEDGQAVHIRALIEAFRAQDHEVREVALVTRGGGQESAQNSGEAQEVLKPFLEDRGTEAYLFDPQEAEKARNAKRRLGRTSKMTPSQRRRKRKAVRKSPPRDHYSRDSYRRAVARACERAGIPHWHPHQLRHNAATRLQRELGIEAARVVLGHKSPLVTEIYVERDLELARSAMARLG